MRVSAFPVHVAREPGDMKGMAREHGASYRAMYGIYGMYIFL